MSKHSVNGYNYKIERGIDCPGLRTRARLPFPQMKHGDSFLVPAERVRTMRVAATFYNRTQKRYFFTVRKTEAGTRVFCLKRSLRSKLTHAGSGVRRVG